MERAKKVAVLGGGNGACKLGVATPIINAAIDMTFVVNRTNCWEDGRSLEELGVVGLDRGELKRLLEHGFE